MLFQWAEDAAGMVILDFDNWCLNIDMEWHTDKKAPPR